MEHCTYTSIRLRAINTQFQLAVELSKVFPMRKAVNAIDSGAWKQMVNVARSFRNSEFKRPRALETYLSQLQDPVDSS